MIKSRYFDIKSIQLLRFQEDTEKAKSMHNIYYQPLLI